MHCRSVFLPLAGLAGAIAMSAAPSQAAESRFWLASQHNFGAKQGFYLAFENRAPDGSRSPLTSLRLILGVADGKQWRFMSTPSEWSLRHKYTVHAHIGKDVAELWLDGKLIERTPGGFQPFRGQLDIGMVPGWAAGPADYLIRQQALRARQGAAKPVNLMPHAAKEPSPILQLFAPSPGQHGALALRSGVDVDIEAEFVITPYPSLRALSPVLDRFGQCRYASWPGKVRTAADLQSATRYETQKLKAWSPSRNFDRYGGWLRAGWRSKATGFYRVERHNGAWWLITPTGMPCFYTGVCSAPSVAWEKTPTTGRELLFQRLPRRSGAETAAWGRDVWSDGKGTDYFAPHTLNLIDRYGPSWSATSMRLATKRIRAFGFCGGGKWDHVNGLPYTPVLSKWDVPNIARHPDVFDPAIVARFREGLRKQIEPHKKDPTIIGWSLGNEYDEIVNSDEIRDILAKGADVPAKRALVDRALQLPAYHGDAAALAAAWSVAPATRDALYAATPKAPAADVSALRRFYAEAYYGCIYRMVKEIDPNHLYLGFWIVPGWWESEEDWTISAPYCDVVGYDRYADEFADRKLSALIAKAGKPILCGEFAFPPFYNGQRGFGKYGVSSTDEADAARRYDAYVSAAARHPYCVGVIWFQYRDQPLTGRGPGVGGDLVYGEHYAFGLVDVTDRPKWTMIEGMRRTNLRAPSVRAHAGASPVH